MLLIKKRKKGLLVRKGEISGHDNKIAKQMTGFPIFSPLFLISSSSPQSSPVVFYSSL